MELINTLKGYDEVSDPENQIPSPLPKPPSRKTLIAIVSIISLLLILALTVGAFTCRSHNLPISSKPLKAVRTNVLNSMLSWFHVLICGLQHIKLSLRVSNLSVSFRSINDMPEETVVGDYVKLYADAVSQLNESISKFKREKKNGGNWLTKRVVGDVKTWISAAMTDDETCSDGLEEMGTVVGNEIKKEMFTVNQMMSISLAIVSQMKKLLIIFH
ncbi:hypothetical protein Bca52824_087283 [Brassica carinata]|uniref:Pectinesterase inhibitor domain-containing protein n=1 Tax=Brassica carinata TaxID=52824 RepID=A0A8X7PAK9_BRACI|nr:hypothetical protein Bca52824_087283 [Brassica carinata]